MITTTGAPAPATEVEPEGLYEVVGGKVVEKPMSMDAAEVIATIICLFRNESPRSDARVFSESLFLSDTLKRRLPLRGIQFD